MRTKVTLVLLFLNVALFFVIFSFERDWRIAEQAMQARRRVLGPEASNIQYLEIATGTNTPLRLRRTNDGWMLISPVEWPANPHAVNRIVNELQFLEQETSFAVEELSAHGQSLADYGLDAPALTVRFSTQPPEGAEPGDAELIALPIGAETTVGNRLYVLSPDGERVHVVGRSLVDSLRVTLEQLRDDSCFTIQLFEVRSLNLQTAGPANVRVRLRKEGTRWAFEAPMTARASKAFTELAITQLHQLRTHTFLGSARGQPELAARAGTPSPTLRVTLEGNNRRETLLLGNPAPAPTADETPTTRRLEDDETLYYAQMEDRDAIFTVAIPDALLETLRSAQEDLRDPRVLPLEDRDVTAITVSAPGFQDLTLQRLERTAGSSEPANWQIVRTGPSVAGPQTRPADREVVERLLQHLSLLAAERFLRDVPSDAELENWGLLLRPERTITLTLAPDPNAPSAPQELKLLLGVPTEDREQVYAKLANQSFVYLVDADILRVTPVVPRMYRDRLIYELPAGGRIVGLNLIDLATKNTLYTHELSNAETWEDVFAREPGTRAAALTVLRSQLRALRAQRYVLDNFPFTIPVLGEQRPWAYQLDVQLLLTAGGTDERETISLFFAPRTGGATQLVGSPTFDVTFEADQALLDAVFALTYSEPTPPSLPPAPAEATPEPGAGQ